MQTSGFEQGIQGMCEGEIRRLTIPASLHICKLILFKIILLLHNSLIIVIS